MRSIKINSLFFLLFLGMGLACKEVKTSENTATEKTGLPYFNTADFTPDWDTKEHKIPDFSFLNQNGNTITNATYAGKNYVANFFFTICPGICPKLTTNMGLLQEAYKNDPDLMLLSHSVMPWNDSVPVLKNYAVEKGVDDSKWNLVTGPKEAIYDIARNGYFADEDFTKTQDPETFIHTENFILVDKEGYIRGVYNGTLELDLERLKRHIEILKVEE
ncbi:SCO family protein [Cyclobacterium qasimii]|uniref:SCO family protein n=2 Tax=Cyclobacterium qasimii TaxID=1350429 RepID=A0A512CCE5_9BACT|nr:SCO family protein [Cyclobacterium qasimii]GEO21873.1 SCO family protein [Cyclobacterium qasimii]